MMLIFLESPEIFLFVILFYNILCAVFEVLKQCSDACGDERCLFILCRISSSLHKAIISITGKRFALFLIAILTILHLKIFINQFVCFV